MYPSRRPLSRATARRFVARDAVIAIVAAAALGSPAAAIRTERVASALNRPIFVSAPIGDTRLFIVEQRGVIKILQNGTVLPTPFLDIDPLIPDPGVSDERGLLGLAFDPSYSTNGRFYVYYYTLGNQTVISRYVVSGNPDIADASSASILFSIAQPATNHNGGTIAFGPTDGYLYLGLGDGGGGGDVDNHAQNPLDLLGKIVRLDVSGPGGYTVPPSNPFVGNPAYAPEIWAVGVRNPYRFSFDRQSADLWIADVGQNLWEEVDFQPAASGGGENYGWRLMEGSHCYNPPTGCESILGLTDPIHEYSHSAGCSITGGYVYRGAAIPSLAGTYFFADYCSNTVWSFRYDGQAVSEFTDRTAEMAPGGGLSIQSVAGFGEDGFGEMYIVDRGSTTTGEIYKILPDLSSAEDPPSPRTEKGGAEVSFSGFAPNPITTTASFALETVRAGHLTVEILDAGGRLVRRIVSGERDAGTQHLAWDAHDAAGREVPAGVYFVRAGLDGRSVTKSVRVVR
jgi:glucose/arabinose dehydrogenase